MLDVGTGLGHFIVEGRRRGWEVWGVEPSALFRDAAEAAARPFIIPGTIHDVPVSMRFDAVVLGAVIEHLPDPIEVIRRSVSHLKPGGLLYVDTQNEDGLYARLSDVYALALSAKMRRRVTLRLAPTFPPFHTFGFSASSLERALTLNGFDIVYRRLYAGVASLPFSSRLAKLGEALLLKTAAATGLGNYMEFVGRLRIVDSATTEGRWATLRGTPPDSSARGWLR